MASNLVTFTAWVQQQFINKLKEGTPARKAY